MSEADFFSGIIHTAEHAAKLAAATPDWEGLSGQTYSAPERIEPRDFMQVENQGATSSCGGHGMSSLAEFDHWIESGGEQIQLSRWYSYLTAQQIGGFFGKDQGVDIESLAVAARDKGICLEATYPFPGRYTTDFPPNSDEDAAKHKLLKFYRLNSYTEMMEFLASGQGGILNGTAWKQSWASNTTGVIEEFTGSVLGGHCTTFLGYSDKKDREFQNYLLLLNSHTANWGKDGWAEVAPKVIAETFDDPMTIYLGCSGMTTPTPRPFDWHGSITGEIGKLFGK